MRALVTGASGFLGRHLCAALRQRGDFIVVLVRDNIGLPVDGAIVFGGFDQVERAIAEYEVDTVFHLAAQTQVSTAAKDPIGTLEANVRGTWTVLEACRRQKVRRVIVASSDKVYGLGPSPYVEDQKLAPHGIYATSKLAADGIAQAYIQEYGAPVAITRCGNLYGPGHLNWSALIPGTIRSVLRGERPQLRSNGGPKRDYLFVEDAVLGYLALADVYDRGAFNLGTGGAVSVSEIVTTILKLTVSDLEPEQAAGSGPGSGGVEIETQVLDCDRARRILNWAPRMFLVDGLAKTIEWYRGYLGAQR